MTKISHLNKVAATLFLVAATLGSSAFASATEQSDVQACREAMTRQSNIDMTDYRLRFKKSKGFRVRTLQIKAILKKGGGSFDFTCTLNRKDVTALKLIGGDTKFALRK